jgi:hypothetical protein
MPSGRRYAKRGANLRKISLHVSRRAAGQKLYLRTKNSVLRLAGLTFLMLLVTSCFDEGDCLITNSNTIKVSLRSFKEKTKPVEVTFTSISIPGDTVLYENIKTQGFLLPVDPGRTEMQYAMSYGTRSDTITFGYNSLSVVLSPTCGAFPYQRNLIIKETTFGQDSIVVVDQSLLKNVAENVRIYF